MGHLLSPHQRNEFLATPQCVRLTMADGESSEPTILIKTDFLTLKYATQAAQLEIILHSLPWGGLAYSLAAGGADGLNVWSTLESEDERTSLMALLAGQPGAAFVFDELLNIPAWTYVRLAGTGSRVVDVLTNAKIQARTDSEYSDDARQLALVDLTEAHDFAIQFSVTEWVTLHNNYVANDHTLLDFHLWDTEAGTAQENVAQRLTDNLLSGFPSVRSPQIPDGRGTRELTDVLLTYPAGTFLIESKALQILEGGTPPSRDKLAAKVEKHVEKASKQLLGAWRSVTSGSAVSTKGGAPVQIQREAAPHAIILIPDLALLAQSTQFGGEFLRKMCIQMQGFVHILDPTELLRVVQAAEMISEQHEDQFARIAALDYYLTERARLAVTKRSPSFQVLFRRN
jgi:hypothetical protein